MPSSGACRSHADGGGIPTVPSSWQSKGTQRELDIPRFAATVDHVFDTPIKGDPVTESSGPSGDHEATCPCTESLCGDRSLHCGDDECVCACTSVTGPNASDDAGRDVTLAVAADACDHETEWRTVLAAQKWPEGEGPYWLDSEEAHDPLCPYEPERRTKCTHGLNADGFASIESITTDVCQARHYWPGTPCECDLIEAVRADQESAHGRCLCGNLNVVGRADGQVNFISIDGVALEDRNEVLDEVLEALESIDGAAFMYIPRVDENQTLVFLADAKEAIEGLRYTAEVTAEPVAAPAASEPKNPGPGQKMTLRPMKASKLVVLPSADAGNRKYSMIGKAREAAAAKRAEAAQSSDMDDTFDTTELTNEDVRRSMQVGLDWAGVTLPELEAQARDGEFTSHEAETVWSRIEYFVKNGIRPEIDSEPRVVIESRQALETRRAEILNQLGMTLEQLAELADSQTLMPEELEAQEELTEIAFLLGE